MAFNFSAPGFVLGAAFAQKVEDPKKKAELELLGGMFGSSPLGLIVVATLANQAQQAGTGASTTPSTGAGAGTDGAGTPGTATGDGNPAGGAPAEAQVPDVTPANTDLGKARELIESRGLKLAGTATVASDQPVKKILGTDPTAGAIVPYGSNVTLLVSAGIEVPNVVRMTLKNATATLHLVGLKAQQESAFEGSGVRVTRQNPHAGKWVSAGSTVKLHSSEHVSGEAPPAEAEIVIVKA